MWCLLEHLIDPTAQKHGKPECLLHANDRQSEYFNVWGGSTATTLLSQKAKVPFHSLVFYYS